MLPRNEVQTRGKKSCDSAFVYNSDGLLTISSPNSFSDATTSSQCTSGTSIVLSTFSLDTDECRLRDADPKLGRTRLRRSREGGPTLPLASVVLFSEFVLSVTDSDCFFIGSFTPACDNWSASLTGRLGTQGTLFSWFLSFKEEHLEVSTVLLHSV